MAKKTIKTPARPGVQKTLFKKYESSDFPSNFGAVERVERETRRDGKEVIISRGWVLSCELQDEVFFCGRSANWFSRAGFVGDPFKSEEDARKSAEGIKQVWESIAENKSRVYETRVKELLVELADLNGQMRRATQVQWRTTPDEASKLESLRLACRQNNVEYAPGRPVVANVDVLRYLFSLI